MLLQGTYLVGNGEERERVWISADRRDNEPDYRHLVSSISGCVTNKAVNCNINNSARNLYQHGASARIKWRATFAQGHHHSVTLVLF
jgi:hypothetical protein